MIYILPKNTGPHCNYKIVGGGGEELELPPSLPPVVTPLEISVISVCLCCDNVAINKKHNFYIITARKTIFPRSWNIIESSKIPCKYHLSINILAEKKPVFPITKRFKTRTSQ